MRVPVAVAVLVLLPWATLVVPPAQAEAADAGFLYELRLSEPFANLLDVTVEASGLPPGPLELRFAGPARPTDVRNASLANGVLLAEPQAGRVRIEFRAPIEVRTAAFALIPLADVVPRPTNASLAAAPARLVAAAPAGWRAATPDATTGYVAFGSDLRSETRLLNGTRLTIVSLAPVDPADVAFLSRAVPHVAAQHAGPLSELLVVRAPSGALREPLVAAPGIALPVDASLEELARLVVRAHQSYRVVEVAPASAAWLREGEERYHALTALVAAETISAAEAQETITRARAIGDPDATLPNAPAGSLTARQKGLVVVRALDLAMRNASNGRAGLADLVAELDATATADARVDSAQAQAAAERVAGADLGPFFDAYVYGTQWPTTTPLARAADIFVTRLAVEPARAAPGQQVVAQYETVNRGTQRGAVELPLALDGVEVGFARIDLDVGQRATLGTPIVATERGDHVVRFAGLNATFRVLAGPQLRLERATATPAEPAAGEPFTLLVYVRNDGEAPGTASLEVREQDLVLQRTTNATIDGGATRAITLPMRLDEAGLHALEVELQSAAGEGTLPHEVNVLLTGTDARDTPAPQALLAVLLALVVIALRRKL